ncbi:phosphoribosylformylglycinamidine synthase [Chromatiales bacterium (ex Bugula neritina AB1)]|nr:phosphoribosylformylglycinamidine synthase [Chromatiales bacterium (ex Bugula neritina AB1)]
MQVLFGDRALSTFRLEAFLQECRARAIPVSKIDTRFVYLINEGPGEARVDEDRRLRELLQAQPDSEIRIDRLVIPRAGTLSPWSTKATDICHNCGLHNIRRVERAVAWQIDGARVDLHALHDLIFDRMTEMVLPSLEKAGIVFEQHDPAPLQHIDVLIGGADQLAVDNRRLGFALSADEIDYLVGNYKALERNPTDAELMMFAQANSEHCRHKIFNADWVVDGIAADASLFDMIRETHKAQPQGTLVAYDDNAAVIEGYVGDRFAANPDTYLYEAVREPVNIQIKVETHNHPTAISPFAGAATGAGGEIRDEGATGNGARPKAGICGFSVSNLRIPEFQHSWEQSAGKPDHLASALDIMLEGPIGAAAFNNEFGRPNLAGYFRTLEVQVPLQPGAQWRGYHKPIMIAGGSGNIRPGNTFKKPVPPHSVVVVLGGPAMLIGLGGGAASSMASGQSDSSLDFASVQRGNPEMERRCQEVINQCVALAESSPVLSMHDVGAGGLSNALPELMHDAGRGGRFDIRRVLNDEPGMSPMELWCNESQERYVLAIAEDKLAQFESICTRERCPYAIVGEATEAQHLLVSDTLLGEVPVDMSLDLLLGKPPKLTLDVARQSYCEKSLDFAGVTLDEAVDRVFNCPAVAAKNFLITIADRSVGGLVHRDQLVGPYQMPLADAAITLSDFNGYSGESMAMGERSPLAMISPEASGRMAVAEALTNMISSAAGDIKQIKLSANWMAASGHGGEDAALFDTVTAVARDFCPLLGISIPVGKDSLSMQTVWQQQGQTETVSAPLSLIITAFAPVKDVRMARTPELKVTADDSVLLLIDLGMGKDRLAGSALAQVFNQIGHECPDIDDPLKLRALYTCMQELMLQELILACHDRSDGGLFTTVAEMAFAANTGVALSLKANRNGALGNLFAEEAGLVIQVERAALAAVELAFRQHGLAECVSQIGVLSGDSEFSVRINDEPVYRKPLAELKRQWWETSYRMQRLRDNPVCADEEYQEVCRRDDPGISPYLTFDPRNSGPVYTGCRPRVAILREQGVNGYLEMAAAFDRAGFECRDVHMTDIINGLCSLEEFSGLVACGGFSYGDVLGAGGGWAHTIRYNPVAADQFNRFFQRPDVFALGVCNGCQMFSHLKAFIPGASAWPSFKRNKSEQFESRLSTVLVERSPSILLTGMEGSKIPVVVAHGEGRVDPAAQTDKPVVTLRYADNFGNISETYPANPNGSPNGVTGLCSEDGRFNIMMPHPERVFRTVQNSWHPASWGEDGPWLKMFRNARYWVANI